MLDIFHSAADLGLVLGGEAITLVAGLLGAGIIADRVSRARLLVLADLMTGIAYIALGLFGHFGLRNIWPYVGAGGIIGVGSALFGVSMDGWVQANVYGDLRQSVNAARSIYRNLASIMGPLIAAVLVALTSPPLAILIAGFLPLIASYIFATTKSTDVSTSVSQPTRTRVCNSLKKIAVTVAEVACPTPPLQTGLVL